MYGAAKASLESVTKSLARELGMEGQSRPQIYIANETLGHEYEATVNAVNPGPVRTKM